MCPFPNEFLVLEITDGESSKEDIKPLMCKCRGVCIEYNVPFDVAEEIQESSYDPLSDKNKPEFIAVVTVFAVIFVVGCI
ncbi:hypothetical protein MAR_038577, partial [Mya arenaria]